MNDSPRRTRRARDANQGLFLSRVRIRNYKSIGLCDVSFRPLTILVGRNGAGKSNFLEALRFVVDGLQTSLDHAIKSRGGIDSVRRRSTGHPRNFAIELHFHLPPDRSAKYEFEIGSQTGGGFSVRNEMLAINAPAQREQYYHVKNATVVKASVSSRPPATKDRLYLVSASGLPEFREAYDALLAMGFYNLNPAAMKGLQPPDTGELLHRDGSNIASVIGRITADEPHIMRRIHAYLASIVPAVAGVSRVSLGPMETLEFRQEVVGAEHPWTFYAASMSDGTLRALGTLVAVTQLAGHKDPVKLVGIEEPETALHPGAAGALMDALREAACHTQVVVTTHSPDLIDQIDPTTDHLLAVRATQGNTEIGLVDEASRNAIREQLYTPGELLRMDQLDIDGQDLDRQRQDPGVEPREVEDAGQRSLFDLDEDLQ